jgi:hypothetical protein
MIDRTPLRTGIQSRIPIDFSRNFHNWGIARQSPPDALSPTIPRNLLSIRVLNTWLTPRLHQFRS